MGLKCSKEQVIMSHYWLYKWPTGSLSSLLMPRQILLALMHLSQFQFSASRNRMDKTTSYTRITGVEWVGCGQCFVSLHIFKVHFQFLNSNYDIFGSQIKHYTLIRMNKCVSLKQNLSNYFVSGIFEGIGSQRWKGCSI